jgi:hypothetical protein
LEEWLGKRWRTEVTLTTDATGVVRWRGFPGWYEARAQDGKKVAMCNLAKAHPTASVMLPETE